MTGRRFGKTSRDLLRHGEPIRPEDDVATVAGNGWAARFDAVRRFVNEPGGVALLVLGVFLGMTVGWLPSPLARIETKVEAHQVTMDRIIALRTTKDDRLAEILSRLVTEVEKQNKRNRIRECAEIKDAELRRMCLE